MAEINLSSGMVSKALTSLSEPWVVKKNLPFRAWSFDILIDIWHAYERSDPIFQPPVDPDTGLLSAAGRSLQRRRRPPRDESSATRRFPVAARDVSSVTVR